ncbi:hypothetical protein [Streptomyces sp. NPDC055140]
MLGDVNEVKAPRVIGERSDEPTGVELRLAESAQALVLRDGAEARFECGRFAERDEAAAA